MMTNDSPELTIESGEPGVKSGGTVMFTVHLCKGCELCVVSCPVGSLAMSDELNGLGYRYAKLVLDNCTGCVNCALVCPDSIITVYRKKKAGRKNRSVIGVRAEAAKVPAGRVDI